LRLATFGDLRDSAGMTPDLIALFLLAGLSSAVTLATVMYVGFPRPEIRFTLVVTLLLVYLRKKPRPSGRGWRASRILLARYGQGMQYRKQPQCVYYCQYHLVLVTKDRRQILNVGIQAYLSDRVRAIRQDYPEVELVEIEHDQDHLPLLVGIPPTRAVGTAVGISKANTSKRRKEKCPFLRQVYGGTEGMWSDGYFVATVGVDEAVSQRYIEHQGQEDSGQAQLELW
jgi:putative transposase